MSESRNWVNVRRRVLLAYLLAVFQYSCAMPEEVREQETSGNLVLSQDFHNVMINTAPISWWRLGESSGTTATDQTSVRNGTYINSPTQGEPGAIWNDVNKAVKFTASQSEYVNVSDTDAHSLVRAKDEFGRTLSTGWGAADYGGSWTPQISTALSHYYVGSGAARISLSNAGTYQIGLPLSVTNADIQVKASWSAHASGVDLHPVAIVARRQNNSNFYRAILRENLNGTLTLIISKNVGGVETQLAAQNFGIYVLGDTYYLRFQLEGPTLRARAWRWSANVPSSTQPTVWTGCQSGDPYTACVTAVDYQYSSGTVSLRASNSGSSARPVVSFDNFWVQRLGLTVYSWIRLDTDTFAGETAAKYVNLLGKGSSNGGSKNPEWVFRIYSSDSGGSEPRPRRLAAYIFNLSTGLGSGADYRPDYQIGTDPVSGAPIYEVPPLQVGTWYQIAATFDSGDYLDTTARVRLYVNDAVYGPGEPESTTWYQPGSEYAAHTIRPGNGSGDVNIGTTDGYSYFDGAIDEVAIFDRKLSLSEITDLYWGGIGVP